MKGMRIAISIAVVLLVLGLVLTPALWPFDESPPRFADLKPDAGVRRGVVADLTVTVSAPGGTRTANLRCSGGGQATGFLDEAHAGYAACVTVSMNETNLLYLAGVDYRGGSCTAGGPSLGSSATIDGQLRGQSVRRKIVVSGSCDQSTWRRLSPLLDGTTSPVLRDDPLHREQTRWNDYQDTPVLVLLLRELK